MSPFTDTHTAAATVYNLSLISLYTSLLCFEVFLLCCSCISCVYMCMQVRMYCMGSKIAGLAFCVPLSFDLNL